MLSTVDRKRIGTVAHANSFADVVKQLGPKRTDEVRAELDFIIEKMQPDVKTGKRTFSSSFLGSNLSPWQHPLSHLYHVARELLGGTVDEKLVQERAALIFGQFVWECVMNRPEQWIFYDPNLSVHDPNREITGKVYFEIDG